MKADMKHFVVVGGGIAGLSAAYHLQKKALESDLPHQLTVLEAGSYWGGKIITDRIDGFVVEGGPDTFIVTKPWGVQLCKELGLSKRLKGTNPHQKNTYILHNERLHPLPGGLTMMIPTEFGPMIRTGLLSWPAKARMGMDFFLPAATENGDETMGQFVTRRLGRAAYESLIEPLMSVQSSFLDAALDAMHHDYGDIEAYFEVGLQLDELLHDHAGERGHGRQLERLGRVVVKVHGGADA